MYALLFVLQNAGKFQQTYLLLGVFTHFASVIILVRILVDIVASLEP